MAIRMFQMFKDSKKRAVTVSAAAIILISPLLILFISANMLLFDNDFYFSEFSKYTSTPYLEGVQINDVHQSIVSFFVFRQDIANLKIFNDKEIAHLRDVRKRIWVGEAIFLGVLLIGVWACILFFRNEEYRDTQWKDLGILLVSGGLLTVLLAFLLWMLIKIDFGGIFTSFHKILFKEGTWLFSPNEIIVQIYQEKLFINAAFRLAYTVIGVSILWIGSGLGIIASQREKKI